MFGVVYAFLFAVWVFVLNDKIQHGPEFLFSQVRTASGAISGAEAGVETGTDSGDTLLEVASRMFRHGRYSLTQTVNPSVQTTAQSSPAKDSSKASEGGGS
jgi:hypothetical protein